MVLKSLSSLLYEDSHVVVDDENHIPYFIAVELFPNVKVKKVVESVDEILFEKHYEIYLEFDMEMAEKIKNLELLDLQSTYKRHHKKIIFKIATKNEMLDISFKNAIKLFPNKKIEDFYYYNLFDKYIEIEISITEEDMQKFYDFKCTFNLDIILDYGKDYAIFRVYKAGDWMQLSNMCKTNNIARFDSNRKYYIIDNSSNYIKINQLLQSACKHNVNLRIKKHYDDNWTVIDLLNSEKLVHLLNEFIRQ